MRKRISMAVEDIQRMERGPGARAVTQLSAQPLLVYLSMPESRKRGKTYQAKDTDLPED